MTAAFIRQKLKLSFGFHPFGNDAWPQAFCHRNNGTDDRQVLQG